jgi:hypothetical protein
VGEALAGAVAVADEGLAGEDAAVAAGAVVTNGERGRDWRGRVEVGEEEAAGLVEVDLGGEGEEGVGGIGGGVEGGDEGEFGGEGVLGLGDDTHVEGEVDEGVEVTDEEETIGGGHGGLRGEIGMGIVRYWLREKGFFLVCG